MNGVSKSYAMTGWTIGQQLSQDISKQQGNLIKSHQTSSISQAAAVEALNEKQGFIKLDLMHSKREEIFVKVQIVLKVLI